MGKPMPAAVSVEFDAASLTRSQLDGLVCAFCGLESLRMFVVGIVAGFGQVFACEAHRSPVCHWCGQGAGLSLARIPAALRPFAEGDGVARYGCEPCLTVVERGLVPSGAAATAEHGGQEHGQDSAVGQDSEAVAWLLGDPCPPWCIAEHTAEEHPDGGREHFSRYTEIPLLSMPYVQERPHQLAGAEPTGGMVPAAAFVDLLQQHREREARVSVKFRTDELVAEMTLTEAELFARHVLRLVDQARGRGHSAAAAAVDERRGGELAGAGCSGGRR